MCTPVQSSHQSWTSQGKLYDHKLQILPHNIHVEYSYHFLDNYHKYNSCEQVTVLDKTEESREDPHDHFIKHLIGVVEPNLQQLFDLNFFI